ncbi:zf-HC2 domain-containing protein [Bdellovibrio sp. BCCA]|uniref:zf-HC2 domain-containing protein n=1 Tax=Bdellovibrio sp. BCCA TaxID=3136281 RepID=UPI0030F1D6E6
MAQQENKIPLSKKGKREISPFIGHELLYDYLSGSLDKERRAAVEDHVKFSRDAQLDLTKIQNGQTYAERLADTVVSQPIIAQISAPSSYLSVLMQKSNFDKWPQGLKWGLEALVVVVAIVTLLTVTPWQKVMQLGVGTGSKEVVLAEVSKNTSSEPSPAIEEKPEFVDEGVSKETSKEHGKETAKETTVAKTTETPKASPTAAATVAATTAVPKKEEKTAAPETAPAAASGGFLYRGEIAVTNIDVIGPKITEKINELGGRKAGSVELGWKKTPGSMYYHFTIPEAKYQDLLTFLGTYGKPKIGKEKHPRVMPDGIVRMIITVDEAKK